MNDISIKGIILGILATLLIDTVSGIAMIPLFAPSMTKEAFQLLYTETGPLIYSMFFGTLSTVVGGFIAANIGRLAAYKNSAIFGVAGLVIGVFLSTGFPLWFNIVGYITVIPASLLGGHIAVRKNA